MYEVCLLNDDYTPMEFVIIVLQKFFAMKKESATQVMLKVHREGRGVCGVYSKDVAASKVSAVLDFAGTNTPSMYYGEKMISQELEVTSTWHLSMLASNDMNLLRWSPIVSPY